MTAPETEELLAGLDGLDRLLEHRVRLGLCVLLGRYDELTFSRLKKLLDETDGNLGANLRRLEDAGYLAVRKEFVERRPTSWYSLTGDGRQALTKHLAALERMLTAAPTARAGSRSSR